MRVFYKKYLTIMFFAFFSVFSFFGAGFALPMLLVDGKMGEVLYAQEAGVAWHPASLTKLMSAFVTFEAIKKGKISLDTPVILSRNALKVPPSKSGLPREMALSVRDALYMIVVKSANDVAIALGEAVSGSEKAFVKEMNETAKALGMSGTVFVNANGLHKKAQVSTARDMAILALNIKIRHPEFNSLFATSIVQLGEAKMKSYNILLAKFRGTNGMKTGFICAAGFNIAVSATRNSRSLIAIVFGASSERERAQMVAQLLTKGFAGEFVGSGKSVLDLRNIVGSSPKNMRPLLCGENAPAYVAKRKREYPLGLEGQQSFLNDNIEKITYRVKLLGKMRNVVLPIKRPFHISQTPVVVQMPVVQMPIVNVPLPRPRLNR